MVKCLNFGQTSDFQGSRFLTLRNSTVSNSGLGAFSISISNITYSSILLFKEILSLPMLRSVMLLSMGSVYKLFIDVYPRIENGSEISNH